jgi:hypothetical protein
MRTSIIIARKHGAKKFEMLSGPETPLGEHKQFIRDTLAESATTHEKFAEIHHYESHNGGTRILRFKTPKEQKELDRLREEQTKEHLESQAAIGRAKATEQSDVSTKPAEPVAEVAKPETAKPESGAEWN